MTTPTESAVDPSRRNVSIARRALLSMFTLVVFVDFGCAHITCAFGGTDACVSLSPPVTSRAGPSPAAPPPITSGVALQDQNVAKAEDLKKQLHLDFTTYVEAPTFFYPEQFLGRIVTVGKPKDQACSTVATLPETIRFELARVTGFGADTQATAQTLAESIVNKTTALTADILSAVNLNISGSQVASLVISQDTTALISSDDKLKTAVQGFYTDNHDLTSSADICWIFVVEGATKISVLHKVFSETQAGADAGAYGIKVSGKYYASTSDFQRDVRWGLQFSVLRRPLAGQNAKALNNLKTTLTAKDRLLFNSVRKAEAPR
jgi:hypothetical protein